MNRPRYWLAGFALLVMANAGTLSVAQNRVHYLNSAERPATARSRPMRRISTQEVLHEPMLTAEDAQPGVGGPIESELPTLMAGEMSSGNSVFMEGVGDGLSCGDGVGDCDAAPQDCLSCGNVCQPCLASGWIQGEYLMWWPRPMQMPALVTSGPQSSEGVLGVPGTQTLVGDQMLNQMYSGGRLRVGLWTNPCRDTAWEVEGFVIGEATDSYTLSGTGAAGSSVLARPFFNVLSSIESPTGREDAELVAFPEQLSGTVTVEATSRLYGVGIHGMRVFGQSCGCSPAALSCNCLPTQSSFAGFLGWRYLNFAEDLRINENLNSLLPSPENGQFLIEDHFETGNSFHGADLGVMWKGCRGLYSVDLLMRLALGTSHQDVAIAGSTTLRGSGSGGNDFENATGGLLAQRTNIGQYSRNRFAVVPELGITLGCAISSQWRATIGYTFLYWSSVVRPGDQIDRNVNPNLFPPESEPFTGLERPVFAFVESDLWVNGLSLGLERTW